MDLSPGWAPRRRPEGPAGWDARDLRGTIDRLSIGIAQFDSEGRFLLVNDRLCEILGLPRREVLGRTFHEFAFPDDLSHFQELTAELATGEIPEYRVEKRFVRTDGAAIWARITVSAVRRADGAPAFFIGVAEDIWKEVAATRARHQLELLEMALGASVVGAFRCDVRERVLEWEHGLDRVLGPVDDTSLEAFFERIHPDDRAHVRESYERSAEEGVDFEEEFRVVWPDGSIHWVHDRGRTARDPDGRPRYIVGAITDVSKHKRMEEVIHAQEAQFRILANSMPQLVWIAQNDGRRTWFNDRWQEYTGRGLDELKGFGWLGSLHPDSVDVIREGQLAAFRSRSIWEETVRLRGSDGEYRWFLSRATPVRTEDGAVLQWFGTDTDITDRKHGEEEREERLEREHGARKEAEEAIGLRQQVLSFVAHDLRNPVQTIVGAASLLLELALDEEERRKHADLIRRSAWQMDRLIGDLLDVGQIDAGTLSVHHGRVPIPDLLSQVREMFEPRATSREVELTSEVHSGVSPVDGDRERLVQLLSNLVGNALRFTPAGGHVCLRAAPCEDEDVEIQVEDSGCGIPEEELPSIFERFWRADRDAGGGAGLGLVIARGIVEAHGGSIDVESVVGEGTTFHVRLPSAAGGAPEASLR